MPNHKEIYHKDFPSSCARGMSNPIAHITRILLAKAKACALQDLFFVSYLDLDLEKNEASEEDR
jgi:hypothetical protein